MPNPFLFIRTDVFQTIQFNISTQLKWQKYFPFKQFNLTSIYSLDIKNSNIYMYMSRLI